MAAACLFVSRQDTFFSESQKLFEIIKMSGEEKKEEVEEIGGEKEVEDLIPDEPGPIRRGATFPTRSTPYDRLRTVVFS